MGERWDQQPNFPYISYADNKIIESEIIIVIIILNFIDRMILGYQD